MIEFKFYVVTAPKEGYTGDIFTKVFDTLEKANEEANIAFDYLTKYEKKRTHVFVGYAEKTDHYFWDLDEDFTWDWYPNNMDIPEGAYDSEN